MANKQLLKNIRPFIVILISLKTEKGSSTCFYVNIFNYFVRTGIKFFK